MPSRIHDTLEGTLEDLSKLDMHLECGRLTRSFQQQPSDFFVFSLGSPSLNRLLKESPPLCSPPAFLCWSPDFPDRFSLSWMGEVPRFAWPAY